MGNKVNINITIKSKELNGQNILEWFKKMTFFNPTRMGGSHFTKNRMKKYDSKMLISYLQNEDFNKKKMSIDIEDEGLNSFSIIKGSYTPEVTWVTLCLEDENYEKNKLKVFEYVDELMKKYSGVVARATALSDFFWQNVEDVEMYRMRGKSMDGVRTKISPIFKNKSIVDIEFNPGHSHIVNGIWFGSCWAMWFGKDFYKFIPKDILRNYDHCFENEELENGVIRILLYENVWEYDNPSHRDTQIEFRKNVGIDEVAHYLEKNKSRSQEVDPSIEIDSGDFQNGGVKRVIYYYDNEGTIVPKSIASDKRIFVFDKDGRLISSKA